MSELPEERKCIKCKKVLLIEEFWNNIRIYVCKKCNTEVCYQQSMKKEIKTKGLRGFKLKTKKMERLLSSREEFIGKIKTQPKVEIKTKKRSL